MGIWSSTSRRSTWRCSSRGWIPTHITNVDSSATPVASSILRFPQYDTSYSTELRFTSTGHSRLSWIGGLNYFNDAGGRGYYDDPSVSRATVTGATTTLAAKIGTQAYGVFGELTYHLTDALSVTGGLRYSNEHRSKTLALASTPFASLPNLAVPVFQARDTHDYHNLSARASVKYDITPDVHTFFTFSQGFKSGFSNATAPATGSPPSFDWLKPETLNNYELGVKSDITRKLRVNVSAFYLDYSNLQVTVRSPLPPSSTTTINAGSATNYGAELSLDWRPSDAWQFSIGVANEHARYTAFPNALVYFPATSTDTTTNAAALALNSCQPGTGVPNGGNRAATCDSKGRALARSPDWTANTSAEYTADLFGGKLQLGGILAWTENYIWDLYGTLDNGGDHFTLNGHATWTAPNGLVSVTVYGDNLTDSNQPMLRFQGAAATYGFNQEPANFGIRLSWKMR
ncbi:MAG: TonB-dependent receptor [Sphingomonas sp.]